jgi:DNA repair photolyase
MEEKASIKQNAVELLDKQLSLRAKKNQYGFIVVSSATDPYLHFEKEEKITRGILEVILKHKFPVHIITKSDLVLRDLDLLREIDKTAILPADLTMKMKNKTIVTFSFSTVNDSVGKIFEPGATPPSVRLKTLEEVSKQGFLTGVSMMPLIPYVSDTAQSLEDMFDAFKKAGAHYVMPASITLFGSGTSDSKTLVLRAIEKHYPHLLKKYQKFFSTQNEMPAYYNEAFYKKMKELADKYELRHKIV